MQNLLRNLRFSVRMLLKNPGLTLIILLTTRGRVVALVLREGVTLAAIGLALGLMGAYFIGRTMQSTLYGVSALDFAAFSAVGLILLVAALLACFLPAQRAASTEPMRGLRTE